MSKICIKLLRTFVLLSLPKHTLNLFLRQTTLIVSDRDTIRFASCFVGSRNVENTVSVDVEGDLNLRDTTRCRGNTGEFEFAEKIVILGACTFTLVNLDEHSRLVVGVC